MPPKGWVEVNELYCKACENCVIDCPTQALAIDLSRLTAKGYHPAFIQVAFRAGDGAFNTIQVVNPFLPLFLETLKKYKEESGIGTYLSLMMPYALSFFAMWYALFIFWYLMGLPVGPGVPQRLW